jgi:hypothetical protein
MISKYCFNGGGGGGPDMYCGPCRYSASTSLGATSLIPDNCKETVSPDFGFSHRDS